MKFLIIVVGDVDPEVHGPYASDRERDIAAKKYRAADSQEFQDGIYGADTTHDGAKLDVWAYSGAFFDDHEDLRRHDALGLNDGTGGGS